MCIGSIIITDVVYTISSAGWSHSSPHGQSGGPRGGGETATTVRSTGCSQQGENTKLQHLCIGSLHVITL